MTLLDELTAGRIPEAWASLDTTTHEEAVFLAPLDNVAARGRAATVFQFDYAWEVCKPASQRHFGYYALPVLWGDRLEDESPAQGEAFVEALALGFARFVTFLGAGRLDATGIAHPRLRERITAVSRTD